MVVGAVVSHSVVGEVVGPGVLVGQALSGAGEDASPDGPYLHLHVPHLTQILIQIPPFLPVRNKQTNRAIKHINYSRLWLSRNSRDSLKQFEISVPRHIRFAELKQK